MQKIFQKACVFSRLSTTDIADSIVAGRVLGRMVIKNAETGVKSSSASEVNIKTSNSLILASVPGFNLAKSLITKHQLSQRRRRDKVLLIYDHLTVSKCRPEQIFAYSMQHLGT